MWLFRRNEQRLIHELRPNGSGYELAIAYQDGWVDIEHFPDAVTAERYALDLRRALRDGGWQPSFFLNGQAHADCRLVEQPRGSATIGPEDHAQPLEDQQPVDRPGGALSDSSSVLRACRPGRRQPKETPELPPRVPTQTPA